MSEEVTRGELRKIIEALEKEGWTAEKILAFLKKIAD